MILIIKERNLFENIVGHCKILLKSNRSVIQHFRVSQISKNCYIIFANV